MFTEVMKAVWGEFRGQATKNLVEQIAPFHRLQASPGYRAAARVCRDWLRRHDLPARILSYPADGRSEYWSFIAGQEWDASEGVLHLVEPKAEARKLADWADLKIALLPGSTNANVTAPLAVIGDHWRQADYRAAGLKGKIVLTRDVGAARRWAVDKYGAVGIIFDGMRKLRHIRESGDLTETLHLRGLGGDKGHRKTFGFVVSPREGTHLRELVAARAARKQSPVMLRARVRARRRNGTYEIVTAALPGRTRQQVLVLAHLCHPQWSANDNASGCAAAMELLRALRDLIRRRALPRPRRGIRILLVPEYAGSYIYLATNPSVVRDAVAGINLDMVGEDQELCKTSFLLERPPDAAASFVSDLAEAIQWALPQRGTTPSSTDRFPLLRQATVKFSGWSDHDVLSDPTVGIPSPMLIQWPDLFYHTTDDTIDKVDPQMLHRAGCLAATYAFSIANAGPKDARWIAAHVLGRFKERIVFAAKTAARDAVSGGPAGSRRWLAARLAYLADLGGRCLDSVRTVARIDTTPAKRELQAFAERELSVAPADLPQGRAPRKSRVEAEAARVVPVRLYKGPVALGRQLRKLPKAKRDAWQRFNKRRAEGGKSLQLTPRTAQFWADGKRTILQIADCLEQDTDGERGVEYLVRYFRLLADLKLVRLEKAEE
jgi:hypothetical protein